MDLMQQINTWHENNEFQRIVDAIEALPREQQTPELLSQLGRAYNNLYFLADGDSGRENLERALSILKPLEAELGDNPQWNFRIGYSYYYLDREALAIAHFKKFLEYDPEDEDTQELIARCKRIISIPPEQGRDFASRTKKTWENFEREEAALRGLILKMQENNGEPGELMDAVQKVLAPAFEDADFMVGYNGEKFELILSPGEFQPDLFPILYFLQNAPAHLKNQWNFICGKPRWPEDEAVQLPNGATVRRADVQVWAHPLDEDASLDGVCATPRYWDVHCWHEALAVLAREDADAAQSVALALVMQSLGEALALVSLGDVVVLDAPENGASMPLMDLQKYIVQENPDLENLNLKTLAQRYSSYEISPERQAKFDDVAGHERNDVVRGETACSHLVHAFLAKDDAFVRYFQDMGITPGFCFYPRMKNMPSIAQLKQALRELLGEDKITFIGAAEGSQFNYLDIIYWGDKEDFRKLRLLGENPLTQQLHSLSFRMFGDDYFALAMFEKKYKPETEKNIKGSKNSIMGDKNQ